MILTLCLLLLSTIHIQAEQLFPEEIIQRNLQERVVQFQKLGPKGYQALSKLAFNSQESLSVRWRAVTTMGALDERYFRKDLERALKAKEWFLRNAALVTLRTASDRIWAIQVSTRALADSALVVRTQAVRNLIDLDAREVEPILWKMLDDERNFRIGESLWVRVHIAEALAKWADSSRVEDFKRMLMDSDERLHKWSVIGLENSTGVRLSDKKEEVEIRRQKWLARLGRSEI